MKKFDSDRVQDRLINRLERKERQQAFQQNRLIRFKLPEIHNKLTQMLLMKKIIETEQPEAISELVLKGLKQLLRISDFDLKYFVSPIRNLVPRPNPYALYMTQHVMEVMIKDPSVIEIYGTDLEIYQAVNEIFIRISMRFERTEEELKAQLARKSLAPGTREYDVALDQLLRDRIGDPQR
jgi:hypothetical protein